MVPPNRLHAGCHSGILTSRQCASDTKPSIPISMSLCAAPERVQAGARSVSAPMAPLLSAPQGAAVVSAYPGPDQHRRAANRGGGSHSARALGRGLAHGPCQCIRAWYAGRADHMIYLAGAPEGKGRSHRAADLRLELRTLPAQLRRLLTYDQGPEMREHRLFTRQTKMRVYFEHPHSPRERATNENTNDLLRQFFPKGTRFTRLSQTEIKRVQAMFNNRPRKILNWPSPCLSPTVALGP